MRVALILLAGCILASCPVAPAKATTSGEAVQHTPARHCWCRERGPRGGCVRWTCRTFRWRH